ncbi:permease-like cell division protein FtsX [Larsenimonas rhizosphaerae]|uniref:permease-like cell division protein FtsX n=1 Tax=Larsenimonas rhizosphaerae TaxID=2944682 RepID=UPI0020334808|nr:permease-like cell division protein FtsX [Larsenimonas rhizosphaerae]MCM2131678.1 permease-like cell division protein FtsX [Larsenimonas rhizosphaerae]
MSERMSSRRGANQQAPSFLQQRRAWQAHHRQVARDSLIRLRQRPLGTLMTLFAIAVALVLPATLWLLLGGAQVLDRNLEDTAQLTVYLSPSLEEASAREVADKVRQRADVGRVELITAAEGLHQFQASLDLGDALQGLDHNPLPASLVVQPVTRTPEAVAALAMQLRQVNGVDEASADMQWLERLKQLTRLGQRIVLAFGALFALGVLLIVGNTIRLAVENRRDEIEVVTLIGATHAFVRRPFLYSGAWLGLGGGMLALVLLAVGMGWLSSPLSALASSYGTDWELPGLGFEGSLLLLVCSTVLGWLGAWIAVGRHLARMRPR